MILKITLKLSIVVVNIADIVSYLLVHTASQSVLGNVCTCESGLVIGQEAWQRQIRYHAIQAFRKCTDAESTQAAGTSVDNAADVHPSHCFHRHGGRSHNRPRRHRSS